MSFLQLQCKEKLKHEKKHVLRNNILAVEFIFNKKQIILVPSQRLVKYLLAPRRHKQWLRYTGKSPQGSCFTGAFQNLLKWTSGSQAMSEGQSSTVAQCPPWPSSPSPLASLEWTTESSRSSECCFFRDWLQDFKLLIIRTWLWMWVAPSWLQTLSQVNACTSGALGAQKVLLSWKGLQRRKEKKPSVQQFTYSSHERKMGRNSTYAYYPASFLVR